MHTYLEFIQQSLGLPQESFEIKDNVLFFHDLNLLKMVEKFETPLRFTYTPIISKKIKEAKLFFQSAILKNEYRGKYIYCYCTKSSHFKHILLEALKNDIHLETSSSYDMPVIRYLQEKGLVKKDIIVICNGHKTIQYQEHIVDMLHDGFKNIIPIIDNKEEIKFYQNNLKFPIDIGIRIATDEVPNYQFYTSRLGIRFDEIIDFYDTKIKSNKFFKLTMLHFFISSGIEDSAYYWGELEKCVNLYCRLQKQNPHLQYLNIGGGLPFKDSLNFEFNFENVINEIVSLIKKICTEKKVREPHIVTEFGKYTVAEASGLLFTVLSKKQQNDKEKWFMLDGSFITNLPDIWAMKQKYIVMPLNNWDAGYESINLGGLSCDAKDYYNEEVQETNVYMPETEKTQYVGFFHTGAYQEVLSGYGGIHHCLLPSPKHIIITKNEENKIHFEIFEEKQTTEHVIKLLGYK